ncbi:MFS general substrate transporter [Amniculicola lignicola CBS 123094]|uniref:MFS general substrate transporter n=1 Tax=Amniculicola lignicola CBS 123094 TaxID=1392246 RepID=A0A6A5X583_9PLEO|nr:MFS general substrate transporter [Amniculicola lignicola CBS 123094]
MASDQLIVAGERTPLIGQRPSTASSTASSLSLTSSSVSGTSSESEARHVAADPKTAADEEAVTESQVTPPATISGPAVARIIGVLLIGGFISNADGSLVLATHPVIASEFGALHDSSWILTSFALAAAATQPLFGKVSDVYGRKSVLLFAYALFGLGCLFTGIASSMSTVILGRVITGAASAGMISLVSVLITDLVPLREVASYRSYVNISLTTGRSIGGPLGGWLADTVGWRWSFLGQVPLAILTIILVGITLPAHTERIEPGEVQKSGRSKLARIDWFGALLMTLSILAFLIPLEIGGDKIPWNHPYIFTLLSAGVVLGGLFIATEAYIAKEPILPVELMKHQDVVASFVAMAAQMGAQTGLMFAVPLYFQITAHVSNGVAGAHLVPAVVGNAVGGILSGVFIRKTGRYKSLILFATLVASGAYTLLILRWHGHTNWLESFYIFPGGFGTGVAQSAIFISIQAAIDPQHMAVATASLYLAGSVGMISGMAGVSAVLQGALRAALDRRIGEFGFGEGKTLKIIERAVSDIHYIDHAKPVIASAVVSSYVEALTWTHGYSLACSMTAFVASLFLRQHKL